MNLYDYNIIPASSHYCASSSWISCISFICIATIQCRGNIDIGMARTQFVMTSTLPYACFNCLDSSNRRVPSATFFIDTKQVYPSNNAGMLASQLLVLNLRDLGLEEGRRFQVNCAAGRVSSSSALVTCEHHGYYNQAHTSKLSILFRSKADAF